MRKRTCDCSYNNGTFDPCPTCERGMEQRREDIDAAKAAGETYIVDENGVRITKGARVTCGPGEPGIIAAVGDPDGEPDGETGIMRGINPSVYVRWQDDEEEVFSTFWTTTGPWDEDAPYECDYLEVVE